jgi:hypothetical protein
MGAILALALPAPASTIFNVAVTFNPIAVPYNAFDPTLVIVSPGDTIQWTNDDPIHQVDLIDFSDAVFNSGALQPGQTFDFTIPITFEVPQTIIYSDLFAPSTDFHIGYIEVQAAPEVATILLTGMGLIAIGLVRRRWARIDRCQFRQEIRAQRPSVPTQR